jgi:hypothetical protein
MNHGILKLVVSNCLKVMRAGTPFSNTCVVFEQPYTIKRRLWGWGCNLVCFVNEVMIFKEPDECCLHRNDTRGKICVATV